jgi:pimeloyl-ACP methyl ester carboxylesterase
MQVMVPFGIPRWRHWFGGNLPAALRGERQAAGCRPGVYGAIYRERADLPASVAEMRAITSLGTAPLIGVAHDPKILSGKAGLDDWPNVQRQKLQLSKNSELVVATGSGHDIPLARPEVIVAAVKKLVAQASGIGGHPGNSLRNALPM